MCGSFFGGAQFIALTGFFCDHLSCAIFNRKAKATEEKGSENAADGGVEDRCSKVLPSQKTHKESEYKAKKASDEGEILHGSGCDFIKNHTYHSNSCAKIQRVEGMV